MEDLGYLNIMHFKKCEKPKDINFGNLPPDIVYYQSEEGYDWYVIQHLFKKDTIKFAYDDKKVICQANKDPSLLVPEGLSIIELPESILPEGFNTSGEWMFDVDYTIIKNIEFYYFVNNDNRNFLLNAVKDKIEQIKDKQEVLGYLDEEENKYLDKCNQIRKQLYLMDTEVPYLIEFSSCQEFIPAPENSTTEPLNIEDTLKDQLLPKPN